MMRYIKRLLATLGLAFSGAVFAADQGTPEEAHALVKKAVQYYAVHGQERTMEILNDSNGDFVDRDLYVFVHDDKGVYYAIAPKQNFIGKNLSKVRGAKGKFIVQEHIDILATQDSLWQEYYWENPVSKKIQLKKTYCEKAGHLHFCSGAYVAN